MKKKSYADGYKKNITSNIFTRVCLIFYFKIQSDNIKIWGKNMEKIYLLNIHGR